MNDCLNIKMLIKKICSSKIHYLKLINQIIVILDLIIYQIKLKTVKLIILLMINYKRYNNNHSNNR
jgi:hypothetical protein